MVNDRNDVDNFASRVEDSPVDSRTSTLLLAGISLVSFGMLAYEVAMTRVLSVILPYHYVFAVISLALLGIGLGAIFSRLLHRNCKQDTAVFSSGWQQNKF